MQAVPGRVEEMQLSDCESQIITPSVSFADSSLKEGAKFASLLPPSLREVAPTGGGGRKRGSFLLPLRMTKLSRNDILSLFRESV